MSEGSCVRIISTNFWELYVVKSLYEMICVICLQSYFMKGFMYIFFVDETIQDGIFRPMKYDTLTEIL